jgi:hypothetical protein
LLDQPLHRRAGHSAVAPGDGVGDKKAAYVADRTASMGGVDATIYKAFGIDWSKTYMTPIGQPIYIANAPGDKQGERSKELI